MREFNAAEAREMTQNRINNISNSDKKLAMNTIAYAINRGEYCVEFNKYDFECYTSVMKWLKELGYETHLIHHTLCIKWIDAK